VRIDDRTPCPLTIHPKKSYFEKTIWGGQSFKDWFLDELSQETVSDGRSQVFKSSCYRFRDPSPTVSFPASDFVMMRQDWHSNSFKAVVDRLFVEDTTYSTMKSTRLVMWIHERHVLVEHAFFFDGVHLEKGIL
jgi:hypothetical protein